MTYSAQPQLNNLKELFQTYTSECTYSKRLRPSTVKSYKEVFILLLKLLPEIEQTKDIHPHVMNVFFKRLQERERIVGKDIIKVGVSTSTIKSYYNRLIAFFRWLEKNEYIPTHILKSNSIKPPAPVYEDERALNDDEVSKIISAITVNKMNEPFEFKRDILIVMILLYTGIRKGELLGLRVQDIDFNAKTLHVRASHSKSKKSRNIPLHHTLMVHLRTYLAERSKRNLHCEALIISSRANNPFSQHGLKHWVRRYSKLSGVRFHLHRFRHTFACALAKRKADIISIMNVMGHSSTAMTERYLRSIKSENAREYIDTMSF